MAINIGEPWGQKMATKKIPIIILGSLSPSSSPPSSTINHRHHLLKRRTRFTSACHHFSLPTFNQANCLNARSQVFWFFVLNASFWTEESGKGHVKLIESREWENFFLRSGTDLIYLEKERGNVSWISRQRLNDLRPFPTPSLQSFTLYKLIDLLDVCVCVCVYPASDFNVDIYREREVLMTDAVWRVVKDTLITQCRVNSLSLPSDCGCVSCCLQSKKRRER